MTEHFKCPECGFILLDWRNFNETFQKGINTYDFECTAFKCGKRFKSEEILQSEAK